MQSSNFRIVPLPTEVAAAARERTREGAPDHALVSVDAPNAYPCRHCLRYAQPGERVVLFPYTSVPNGFPYSEHGPIFVHEKMCEPYAQAEEYPAEFRRHRVLRAYNQGNEMIDAVVLADDAPETVIEKLLQKSETAYLQARSVSRGCYTFRIERA